MNFFKRIEEMNVGKVPVDAGFVKSLQDAFHITSNVTVIIKMQNNMVGARVQIYNRNNAFDLTYESGVDEALLDAILSVMIGDKEALNNYKAEEHYVETNKNYKIELLDNFIISELPVSVRTVQGNTNNMIEVTFTVAYGKHVKMFFSEKDSEAIETLKGANIIG